MSPPGEPELSLEELAGDVATLYEHLRTHADRLASLRQTVTALDARLAELAGDHPAGTLAFRWENLTEPERRAKQAALAAWVDTIAGRYRYDEIPGCPQWHAHDALVEELTALWTAWTAAYAPGAHPTEPLRWHEALHRARERLADLRGGCTPAEHHRLAGEDDQPHTPARPGEEPP